MKTLDEIIKAFECCENGELNSNCEECSYVGIGSCRLERENDALYYLKAFRDAKNMLDVEREKTIEAYCQWKDAKEKLEAQTIQTMWADNHFQFEISDNPPLTWDELKTMLGQPVWLVYDWNNIHYKGWILLDQLKGVFIIDAKDEWALCEANIDNWKAYRKERK